MKERHCEVKKDGFNIEKRVILYIFFFVVGALFVLNFSYSTSPLTPTYWGGDTAQFLTIGKEWYRGKVPYRDLFDHKGPLIFFVDMLGFALSAGTSATGVFLIQTVFMFGALIAFYKIGRLFLNRTDFGIIVSILTLICAKANYIEGNTVEEYCVPFIAWSLYGILKWLTCGEYGPHEAKWAFLYGTTFAVCLLTRVTNAITIIPGILIIFLVLIKKRQYKNIFQNIVAFWVGCLILVIPFSLYFAWKGCFWEYLDGMIFYNIKYANARKSWLVTATGEDVTSFIKNFFLAWSVFVAAFLSVLRKKKILFLFYFFTGILEMYLFLSGDNFGQYAYVCLPQICCVIGEIALTVKGNECETVASFMSMQVLCWFMAFNILNSMSTAIDIHRTFSERWDRGWDALIEEIPESERNSFVAYGDNRFKELYLLNDISPCYKYFAIQEWHASMSSETHEKIHRTFASCKAKWIAVCGETGVIDDVLENRYELVDSREDYLLYRLKD